MRYLISFHETGDELLPAFYSKSTKNGDKNIKATYKSRI